MDRAIRHYKLAFRDCAGGVSIEVEEFICWILDEEPDKVQFHFVLGFLNHIAKGDRIRARSDYERFLELTTQIQFVEARRIAIEFLARGG